MFAMTLEPDASDSGGPRELDLGPNGTRDLLRFCARCLQLAREGHERVPACDRKRGIPIPRLPAACPTCPSCHPRWRARRVVHAARPRVLASTGRPEFGRGAPAGVERGFRALRHRPRWRHDARVVTDAGLDGLGGRWVGVLLQAPKAPRVHVYRSARSGSLAEARRPGALRAPAGAQLPRRTFLCACLVQSSPCRRGAEATRNQSRSTKLRPNDLTTDAESVSCPTSCRPYDPPRPSGPCCRRCPHRCSCGSGRCRRYRSACPLGSRSRASSRSRRHATCSSLSCVAPRTVFPAAGSSAGARGRSSGARGDGRGCVPRRCAGERRFG
jgi:hypothetical protein